MRITEKTGRQLIYTQLIYLLFINIGISMIHLPAASLYLTDAITLLLFICSLKYIGATIKGIYLNIIYLPLGFLSILLISTTLYNGLSIPLFLWAIRNTYRFFMFFFICIIVLIPEDIDRIFMLMCKIQIINVLLSLYQYFFMGIKQDFLGGIFGVNSGCNAWSNIYFCIITTFVICKYINNKISKYWLIFIVSTTLLLGALAELKIFFIEFVLILIGSILWNKPSKKMVQILIFSLLMGAVGIVCFANVFPDAYATLIDYQTAFQYASSSSWGYGISRLGALSDINRIFFHNNLFYILFGMGFGNCESSNFSLCKSVFSDKYEIYGYRWFSHQMWYLEGGVMGFLLFISFFVVLFFYVRRVGYYLSKYSEYISFTKIFIMILVINLWYNQGIRIEVAYFSFFALAVVPVLVKHSGQCT